MCAAFVYLVTGDQELETSVVSSNDPRFSRCFAGPLNQGLEVNDDGFSSITAPVTDEECMSGRMADQTPSDEYTVSITTPNIRVTHVSQANVFFCVHA